MNIEHAGQIPVEGAFDSGGRLLAACLASNSAFGEFAKKFIAQGCEIRTITIDDVLRICADGELA